ncbi:transposase [Streptomyces sp. V2I9]|nr:transposase [Streptomyces sp. V2I9]
MSKDSAGGRPADFDRGHHRHRNEVERTSNRLQNSRTAATCYGRKTYTFHGTVIAAAVRLWLRP